MKLTDEKLREIIRQNYDALKRLFPAPRDMSAYRFLVAEGPATAAQIAKRLNHSEAYSEIVAARLIEAGWAEQRGKHYFAIHEYAMPTFEAFLESDPILKTLAARKPETRHAMRTAWTAGASS